MFWLKFPIYAFPVLSKYLADSLYLVRPASILYKSIAGRYRPVRVADGPITARYRFIKNASNGPLKIYKEC